MKIKIHLFIIIFIFFFPVMVKAQSSPVVIGDTFLDKDTYVQGETVKGSFEVFSEEGFDGGIYTYSIRIFSGYDPSNDLFKKKDLFTVVDGKEIGKVVGSSTIPFQFDLINGVSGDDLGIEFLIESVSNSELVYYSQDPLNVEGESLDLLSARTFLKVNGTVSEPQYNDIVLFGEEEIPIVQIHFDFGKTLSSDIMAKVKVSSSHSDDFMFSKGLTRDSSGYYYFEIPSEVLLEVQNGQIDIEVLLFNDDKLFSYPVFANVAFQKIDLINLDFSKSSYFLNKIKLNLQTSFSSEDVSLLDKTKSIPGSIIVEAYSSKDELLSTSEFDFDNVLVNQFDLQQYMPIFTSKVKVMLNDKDGELVDSNFFDLPWISIYWKELLTLLGAILVVSIPVLILLFKKNEK